ncbi:MAG TPA: hypothetical protein VK668_11780 [Mucilaginibacter sp.]|nr:hypothetical protein [Mucilaginibacter sp.]
MNHLFTLKARIILLACIVCQFGIKAQAATHAKTDTTLARKSDTTLAKKADTSYSIKADTSLSIKAGSTMVIRADTTLVINADAALIAKVQDAIAKKADAVLAAAPEQKADTIKKSDTTKKVNTGSRITIVPQPTDGTIQVKNTSNTTTVDGVIQVKSAAGTTLKDTTTNALSLSNPTLGSQPAAKTQDPAIVKDTQTAPPVSAPASNTDASTAVKTDPAVTTVKTDATTTAVTDTTLAKKTDTTLMKKADTTLVKRSDTTIVQKDTTAAITEIKAQSAYLEVGGAGLAISANFDSRFKKERNGWGYKVGLGFFTSGGNTVFTVPFQINYLIGEHSHMLELGAGTTFLNSTGTNTGTSKFEFDKVTGFIGTATIGYRFQPVAKGITVRLEFTPILYDEGLLPIGGISVGYTFK